MTTSPFRRFAGSSLAVGWIVVSSAAAPYAQALTERGFLEGRTLLFPESAPNDPTRALGDVLARGEVFFKATTWIQFAAGVDLRASSHGEVDGRWRVDVADRDVRRPAVAVRRLTATIAHGPVTLDIGKQFIRWGKTDILTPTDRFAPRDFMNIVETEFLPVTGARAVAQLGDNTVDAVWVPFFTPSRMPLIDQRWTVLPPAAPGLHVDDEGSVIPQGSQVGIRVAHTGALLEYSLSAFDGFNNLPNVEAAAVVGADIARPSIAIRRAYPSIRTFGGDAALPTKWLTLKGEAAYFTSSSPMTDEYVLYVLQVERQAGEWVFVGGYAGEVVTAQRAPLAFAPDRGLARSIVGRASYTIDPNRSVAFETAVRENGRGEYARAEYSQARGQHWRLTIAGVGIGGQPDDFLGQYRRNSHLTASVRYSF